jgi:hypothetical protein
MNAKEALLRLGEYLGRPVPKAPDELFESQNWLFIPYGGIGCGGWIIDKADGHVNRLGSQFGHDDDFWGHNHGLKHDTSSAFLIKIF